MAFERAAGVLMHPTSLPGPFGIGDLGPSAYAFLDFLARAGQRWWQVLPLGPTGYGDSPYSALSAFAGNPLLISPERLVEDGLLQATELADLPDFPAAGVDFGWVITWKRTLLETAFERFRSQSQNGVREDYEAFCGRADVVKWLPEYALFMALKEAHGGQVWNTWSAPLAQHQPDALAAWAAAHDRAIAYHMFCQFLFRQQWDDLKADAAELGIGVVGDIPIFVAYDSCDVWAHRELFELQPDGTPISQAGVPPDYFSKTGQLWGNPIYDWTANATDGFGWWLDRFENALTLVDAVRLDHFRGFEAYWRVPAGEPTAEHGRWVKSPGRELFSALRDRLGELPILAEDLGVITDDVDNLRLEFGFPGMKVLQFAFAPDGITTYLPHDHEPNCLVYTGTHDNDTTVGWWHTASEGEQQQVRRYLGYEPYEVAWAMIRLALGSVADTVLVPMQDLLSLGSDARMNTPGAPAGNWCWRLDPATDLGPVADRLQDLTDRYDRLPGQHADKMARIAKDRASAEQQAYKQRD